MILLVLGARVADGAVGLGLERAGPRCEGWLVSGGVDGSFLVLAGWLRRGGEAGEGRSASFAGFGREPGGGSPVVFGLAGFEGARDALVADGEQAGQPQVERGQAHEAALN